MKFSKSTISILATLTISSSIVVAQDWQTSSNGSEFHVVYGDYSHGRDPNGPGYDGFSLEKGYHEVEAERKEAALRARNAIAEATSQAMPTAGTVHGQTVKSYFESYRYFIRLNYYEYSPAMLNGEVSVPYSEIKTTDKLTVTAQAILREVDSFEAELRDEKQSEMLKARYPKIADVGADELENLKLQVAEAYTKVTIPFFLEVQDIVFKAEKAEAAAKKANPKAIAKGEASLIRTHFNLVRRALLDDPLSLATLIYAQRISGESPKTWRDIPNDENLRKAVLAVYAIDKVGANYKKALTPAFLKLVSERAFNRSSGQFDYYTKTSTLEKILKPFIAR